jgi:hypothetical protein
MNGVPTDPLINIPAIDNIVLSDGLLWIWIIVCCIFIAHWVIASYHWYTFGSERSISILSIAIYGGGGLFVLITMGTLLLIM